MLRGIFCLVLVTIVFISLRAYEAFAPAKVEAGGADAGGGVTAFAAVAAEVDPRTVRADAAELTGRADAAIVAAECTALPGGVGEECVCPATHVLIDSDNRLIPPTHPTRIDSDGTGLGVANSALVSVMINADDAGCAASVKCAKLADPRDTNAGFAATCRSTLINAADQPHQVDPVAAPATADCKFISTEVDPLSITGALKIRACDGNTTGQTTLLECDRAFNGANKDTGDTGSGYWVPQAATCY